MLRRCCCIAAAVLVVPIAGLVSLRAAAEAEGKGALSRIASDLARRARELDVATPFDPLIKDAHNRTNALRQYDVQSSGDAATRPADSRRSLEGLQAARHYFRLIHASQSPDVPDCRRRRLLLTQFPDDSYEGTGSVLSSLVISLAEAFYSNRTLIWGADRACSPRPVLVGTPALDLFTLPRFCSHPDARAHSARLGEEAQI